MTDMHVDLRRIPGSYPCIVPQQGAGVTVRRGNPSDLSPLRQFVEHAFSRRWADAVELGLARQPSAVFLAARDGRIVGFAMYDGAYRGYFGPIGVVEDERKKGIGSALLLVSLEAMKAIGYAYAVIGEVGPVEFYEKVCGAHVIPGS